MTQEEYNQKKRGCWKQFCKEHGIITNDPSLIGAFGYAFDQAYAIAKQKQGENEMETEKFKVGDKVIFKNTGKPKIVVDIAEDGKYIVTSPDGKSPYRVYGSDLEPHINPEKVSRNLSQETANCDKPFDNILKDSATHANVATSAPNIATSSHNVATSSISCVSGAPPK